MGKSAFAQEELYVRVDIIKKCRRPEFFNEFWQEVKDTLAEYTEASLEYLYAGIPTGKLPELLASEHEHVAYFAYLEMLKRELVPNRIPPRPRGVIRSVKPIPVPPMAVKPKPTIAKPQSKPSTPKGTISIAGVTAG